ncbi:MAG: hypothetical protein ABI903_05105 [Actinomycetota bacterium]
MNATKNANLEVVKQIEYLSRALKAPRIREAATRLGEQARELTWTHEEYLAQPPSLAMLSTRTRRPPSGSTVTFKTLNPGSATSNVVR